MRIKTDINQPTGMMRDAGKRPFLYESKTQAIKDEDQYYEAFGSEENCRFYRVLCAIQKMMSLVITNLAVLIQKKKAKKTTFITH